MNRFESNLFEIAKPLATATPQQYPTPGQSQKEQRHADRPLCRKDALRG
jgi:hypothetical protein